MKLGIFLGPNMATNHQPYCFLLVVIKQNQVSSNLTNFSCIFQAYSIKFMPFAGDFCTIMREPNPKAVYPCFIVPYFSSPNLKYNGEALGVDWEFDNAKWIKVQIVP
jgi:hypothetical protein